MKLLFVGMNRLALELSLHVHHLLRDEALILASLLIDADDLTETFVIASIRGGRQLS